MKLALNSNKILAIVSFYVIAVAIRYYFAIYKPDYLSAISDGLLYAVLTGIGPFIGSMVVIYFLHRKISYSSFGKSTVKSLISFFCPVLLFCVFDLFTEDHSFTYTKIVVTCLIYAYFEEYGWRGYLQSELINFPKLLRILLITVLWFVWHLNFELSVSNLVFFAILFFGSWGIGQIAIKSNSIIACACFHSVINISQNISLTVTTLVLLSLSVVLWFFLWYRNWGKKVCE